MLHCICFFNVSMTSDQGGEGETGNNQKVVTLVVVVVLGTIF